MLELPSTAPYPGRRALFDPKELRLEQRLDNGGTVDCHEGAFPASAQVVQLSRDEFFAGARFPLDEDCEISCRDALNLCSQRQHRVC